MLPAGQQMVCSLLKITGPGPLLRTAALKRHFRTGSSWKRIIPGWPGTGDGRCWYCGPITILTTIYDACDVAWWDGGYSRARLSSQLYQWEPVLEYENLDFNGRYILRVSGMGEALARTDGERLKPVIYNKGIGGFKEFVIPKHITRDGKMRLTFDRPEESHLNWKEYSHISDVWLIDVSHSPVR